MKASRVLLWSLPVFAGGVLALTGIAYGVAASAWGNRVILDQVLPRIQPTAGAIHVAGWSTDLLHRVEIDGLEIVDPDGLVLIRADHLAADLSTLSALAGQLDVADLQADGLLIDIADPAVFSRMWPGDPDAGPWEGLPIDIVVAKGRIAGNVRVGAWAILAAELDTTLTARGRQFQASGLHLRGITNAGPLTLAGEGAWSPGRLVIQAADLAVGTTHSLTATLSGSIDGDRLALHVPRSHVDFVALAAIVPAAGVAPIASPIDAQVDVSGTTSAPSVLGTLSTAGGVLTVDGGVDLPTHAWRATVTTTGFETQPVLVGIEPIGVSGNVVASGTGWAWPTGIEATADADLVVAVKGESISALGPVTLSGGVLHLDAVHADTRWAVAVATGDVDLVARRAELQVQEGRIQLSRFKQKGRATFDGAVVAEWADVVRVNARGQLAAFDLDTGGVRIASARGPIDAGWDGRNPTGKLDLRVADVRFQDRHADTGVVHATLGDRIGFDVVLDDGALLSAKGSYRSSTGELILDAADVEVAEGLRAIAQGTQRVRITRGSVAEAHVDLRLGDARLTADGAPGAGPVTVKAERFDLSVLERIAGERYTGWAGLVDADAVVTGKLDAPRITGTASARGLVIPGQLDGLDGGLTFDSDGTTVLLDANAGSEGATLATVSGRIPVAISSKGARLDKDAALDAHATLSPLDTEALEKLLAGRVFPKAHVEGDVVFTGTLHDPKAKLNAVIQLRGEGTPAATIRADIDAGKVAADVSLAVDGTPHARVHADTSVDTGELRAWVDGGPLPSLTGALSGTAEIERLPVATLRRFTSIPADLSGYVDGHIVLGGQVDAPTFGGDVALVDGRIADLGLSTAKAHLVPARDGYTVGVDVAFARMVSGGTKRQRLIAKARAERPSCAATSAEPAGSFSVAGFVPLAADFKLDRPGLDLALSGSGIPLAAAESFSDQVMDTSGCLVVGGRILGTLAAPDLQLSLDLKDAATSLPALGIRVDDIQLDALFDGSEVQLRSLTARTRPGLGSDSLLGPAGGTVRVTGTATFGEAVSADGRVSLDRAWVMARSDQRAQVSGDLRLKLKDGYIDTTGRLNLDDGYFHVGERFFLGDRATRLDPDIEVVRTRPVAAAVVEEEATPLVFRPSIDVVLARHARIDVAMPLQGAYGDLARALTTLTVRTDLDGELHISHVGDALRISGEVSTEGGGVDVLGRPFDLGEGIIAFTGVDYTAPILDLQATHHAAAGDIVVTIGGVPSAPTLAFTSDTIADDDIVAVLVLGAPLDELDNTSPNSAAFGLVSSLVRNQVASNVGESFLRVESFEFDESSTSLGFSLGRNLTLTTGYHFEVTDPLRENQFEAALALALLRRSYLELSSGSAGVTSLSWYWKLRF